MAIVSEAKMCSMENADRRMFMAENEVKNDLISRTAVINLLKKLRLDNVAMNDKRITN